MNRDQERQQRQATGEPERHSGQDRPVSARKTLMAIVVLGIIAALVAIAGIVPRVRARSRLQQQTNALAPPDVLALAPQMGEPAAELALPGNIQAYTDSPIYARTDGYLKKWYFDIGARVHKGQLLAVISSPEVDQQLLQAQADLATAQASAGLASANAKRYESLLSQNAVSRQDTDTFVSQQASTSSAVKSAQANVQRLKELQSFENIYAPFSGVITARNVDIGQLINAGTAQQMFRLADVHVLRVYVNIPQSYSADAQTGLHATITLPQFPGQTFAGKLVRTANAIDPSSRTLLAEFDIDNRKGKLTPGGYAEVHMSVHRGAATLVIPVSALIFRAQGLQVGTLIRGSRGDVAKLVGVTLGQDDGKTVQVLTGLNADSLVIQNPPDALIDGERVHVIQQQKLPQSQSAGGPAA